MITNYIPDMCGYGLNNLKKVVHIFSESANVIHIDNGEAYVTSGITDLQTISATSVSFEEATAYDDRFKFQKTVTATVNGFAKLSALGGKYYIVLEDVNGIMWLVNADYPSLVTYTYTLQDGTDETVFTFSALSNFPTLKLNASINNAYACQNYSLVRVDEIKMLEKRYANINASTGIVYGYSNQVYKTVRPYRNSIKVEETFDGTDTNTTIQFSIGLDDYQSSWHYNMLEYPYNKYVAVIDHLACGFEMGLVPSYNVQGSHQIGGGDTVTVTLVGGSQKGSEWAESWMEVTVAPVYEWRLSDEWMCQPVEYRWTESGTTCDNANKYQNNIKEKSTDGGTTWSVVIPEEYSASTLVEQDSYDCGYRTDTTSGTPYCTGYDKYVDVYSRTSRDGGTTWTTASTTPTLVEANSPACGYVPPTPFLGKYKFVLQDLSVVSADCDSTSAITRNEISAYSATVVSVNIGNCVTEINEYTFRESPILKDVTMSESVRSIGDYAFYRCYNLIDAMIYSGLTNIGKGAFYNCSGLTKISIPDGVVSVGDLAFQYCHSLTSVTIPSSVVSVGQQCFWHCNSLISATIKGTNIGQDAFSYCYNLTGVTIGSTNIDRYAFQNCSGLTSVILDDGLTSIGEYAFQNCTSLTSVTCLATTPPTLGSSAFDNTNDCPIYVPSSAVNTYKSNTGWSTYASRIYPIPGS